VLSMPTISFRRRCRDERGFTLIETLVAMVCGIIVMGALFAILEISLKHSNRQADVVEATQLGRVTMTRIVDKLHSSCLLAGFNPVLAGSTRTTLLLVNAYSEQAEPALSEVHLDKLVWTEEEAAEGRGTLKDYSYVATSGPNKEGEYTFSATANPATGTVIGERIKRGEVLNEATEKKEPALFSYYVFASKAATSTSQASSALVQTLPEASGLTAAQASAVSAVEITFNAAPSKDTKLWKEISTDQRTQVTLTFSAPNSEATLKAGPCE